ncbi:IS30 family transposase [Desulfosediminicola sp.]|uniref:IS30 family transposase n=1 Tax=Desulfosediminicola sp. TaxID=2886825 RepID=UPI003AF3000D
MKQYKPYRQLTQEQRYRISGLRKARVSIRAIAEVVGVSFSTISRELKRNSGSTGYDPDIAQNLSKARRTEAQKKHKRSTETNHIISESLSLGWSPETISYRMQIELPPEQALCHSTLYTRIKEDKARGGTLFRRLPRFGKRRWKGGKRINLAGASLIPNRRDISERPTIVDECNRVGDWEGDTVHALNGYLVTLVDRMSRFTLVKRIARKTKEQVASAMTGLLNKVPLVRTVTLDNGSEFAAHAEVAAATNADIYFAKPHASWQRGTNENTNGRIRRFWPKGFDISVLSEQEIEDRNLLLNLTLRKVLGGLTPLEAFL